MIDCHSHTIFSDGELLPSELVRRAQAMGHRAIALTDHVDLSNLDHVLPRIVAVCAELNRHLDLVAIPGVELTHVPPATIAPLAQKARELGAGLVLVHGETLVEPVPPGTNLAALHAKVDILAHPGLLSREEAALAAGNGVVLEITSRKGHSLGNGRVARLAKEAGARLTVNTDTHAPGDLIDLATARRVALGAGLGQSDLADLKAAAEGLVFKATGARL